MINQQNQIQKQMVSQYLWELQTIWSFQERMYAKEQGKSVCGCCSNCMLLGDGFLVFDGQQINTCDYDLAARKFYRPLVEKLQ